MIKRGQSQSSSALVSQQQRQQLFPHQLVVPTILSLLLLWEMHLKVSVSTESPDTANKFKSIGLSLSLQLLATCEKWTLLIGNTVFMWGISPEHD